MTDQILPHQLPKALDRFETLRVLSLDCFDTLLWRDSHAPTDVLAALPEATPLQRGHAEVAARRAVRMGHGRKDVTISEIYAELMPNASPAERNRAIAAEIAAEARHCFAFAPTVALMREAHARGLRVIIVSDTYLDARQLRELLLQAAGEDVAGLIDRIFCSSAFGLAKCDGLYGEVLRKLSARPQDILHIGDNLKSDVEGVAPFGVNTLHLQQFSAIGERRLRLESAIGAIYHRVERGGIGAPQPHRATLAVIEPQLEAAAEKLGAAVLGPVLYGFERWLRAEAEALQERRGGQVHWLFLMRDGHLPCAVHETLGGAPGHAIEISRFAAVAASFDGEVKVLRYVEKELGLNPETLARQLLLPEAEVARLAAMNDPQTASQDLLRTARTAPRRKAIVKASRAYATRLVAHVREAVRPAPGDTLMLIDLGYNGSVQNAIDALLTGALDVHVAGRYLLLRERDRPGLDKRGLIDAGDYNVHALDSLCANVSVLEQLCTTAIGSVLDYTADGAPIRGDCDIKGGQSAVRDSVQAGCLAFARVEGEATIRRAQTADAANLWRQAAASALARLMYLPLADELAVVERFQHDVNLGSSRIVPLFDRAIAEQRLRERGLFYMKGSERMYLPAELTGSGLATQLTLLAHKCFGLRLQFQDFGDRTLKLQVIYADRDSVTRGEVEACATHDGYYLAAIAIGDCRYSVALQFGALFEWVEVVSTQVHPLETFLSEKQETEADRTAVSPMLEGISHEAGNLYRCDDEAGFMMVRPPARVEARAMILAVVFRPVVTREVRPAQPDAPHPCASSSSPVLTGARA